MVLQKSDDKVEALNRAFAYTVYLKAVLMGETEFNKKDFKEALGFAKSEVSSFVKYNYSDDSEIKQAEEVREILNYANIKEVYGRRLDNLEKVLQDVKKGKSFFSFFRKGKFKEKKQDIFKKIAKAKKELIIEKVSDFNEVKTKLSGIKKSVDGLIGDVEKVTGIENFLEWEKEKKQKEEGRQSPYLSY